MKVLCFANTSWYLWNFRKKFLEDAVARGHEVIVLAPDSDYQKRFEILGCQFHLVRLLPNQTNVVRELAALWRIIYLYRSLQPQVAFHFTIKPVIYGSISCWLSNVKAINTITGLGNLFLRKRIGVWIGSCLYRLIKSVPTWTFFQNPDDQKFFVDRSLVNETKHSVVPGSGIDLKFYCYSPKYVRSEQFCFLFIGRILKEKGIVELMDATRYLKNSEKKFQVLVVGKLELDDVNQKFLFQLEEWANGGLAKLVGFVDDVRGLIKNCDCVVLPSYREGVPRSLLEGAAIGRPLIATNVPGCKEIVIDQCNGFICVPKSGEDLARKMSEMMKLSDTERQSMGEFGREYVEQKFDQGLVNANYLQWVRKS